MEMSFWRKYRLSGNRSYLRPIFILFLVASVLICKGSLGDGKTISSNPVIRSKIKLQKGEKRERLPGFKDPVTRAEAMNIMFKSLEKARDFDTAAKILRNLARIADRRALPRLGTWFLDPVAGVEFKREVAKTIFAIGKRGEYAPVVELFNGGRYSLRNALAVFFQLKEPMFAESCGACALDARHNEDDRVLCLQVAVSLWDGKKKVLPLLKINHLGADDILAKAIEKSGSNVKIKVKLIRLVGLNKIKGLEKLLLSCLRDKNPDIAVEAALSLGKISSPSSLPALFSVVLKDKRLDVRAAALKAIYNLEDERVDKKIYSILTGQDRNRCVNFLTAAQVAGCGPKAALFRVARKSVKIDRCRALLDGVLADCNSAGGAKK